VPAHDMPEKVICRLKALGMVPGDIPIGIVFHRKRTDRFRWEVVDGKTKQPFRIGSLVNMDGMFKSPWDVAYEGDWVILSRRET
jgi:hypothetical protein